MVLFYGCVVIVGLLVRGFWITFCFFEIVTLWKLAPRLHESSIFKVWRGLVLYIFVLFWGVGFGMAPGMDFEWFLDGFWEHFGFQNRWQTEAISGVIFEGSKKGATPIWIPDPKPRPPRLRILSKYPFWSQWNLESSTRREQ